MSLGLILGYSDDLDSTGWISILWSLFAGIALGGGEVTLVYSRVVGSRSVHSTKSRFMVIWARK